MQAAIEAIAEAGYRGATFARIARQAGLSSTGLISYHFAGRDELIGEVVATVIGDIGAFMTQRMAGVSGPPAALRAYIEGNAEFTAEHRAEMKALLEIFLNGGCPTTPAPSRRCCPRSRRSCAPGSAAVSSARSTQR